MSSLASSGVDNGGSHQTQINLAFQQQIDLLGRGHARQIERHPWIFCVEGTNRRAHFCRGDVVNLRDPQRPHKSDVSVGHPLLHRGRVLEQAAGFGQQDDSRLRQLDRTRGALKELHAEIAFQFLYLGGQGRLRQSQHPRGLTEVQLRRHGAKRAQLSKFHPDP